jgi:PAS domain-containing protein
VIVQHLDPTHEGAMPELLQRATHMPVAQVKDGTRVEADHVYVIPPNKDLSILRGVLHLSDPASPRGLRLPIDGFLRALSDDQRSASVAVILSGMGTDGTLGIKAVKEHGGLLLVQEPSSAKFDNMPRSAIDTRLVDVVAPAHELPARLLAVLGGARAPAAETAPAPDAGNALDKIVLLLRSRLGCDFSQYKRSTIEQRVARRFAPVGYVTLDAKGTIFEINLVAASLLGKDRGRLLGQPFASWVTPATRPALERLLAALQREERASCDLAIARRTSGCTCTSTPSPSGRVGRRSGAAARRSRTSPRSRRPPSCGNPTAARAPSSRCSRTSSATPSRPSRTRST